MPDRETALKYYEYNEAVGFTPSGRRLEVLYRQAIRRHQGPENRHRSPLGEQPGGRSNYFLFIQRDEDLRGYKKLANGSPASPSSVG